MFVEQVQNFFSGKDFLDLVEDFKVIFSELVIYLIHLGTLKYMLEEIIIELT